MSIYKAFLKEKTIKSDKMHSKFNCSAILGFTLAEVLVTLGIIGVVSAMTIPTLVKNHQRQVYVTQLQKVYTELNQAFESALTDNNAVSLRESKVFGRDGSARNFFDRYFKVIKNCEGSDLDGCFVAEYENLNGETYRLRNYITSGCDCAVIVSGAAMCIHFIPAENVAYIDVDINGKQGPNIVGRDMFQLVVRNERIISASQDSLNNFGTNAPRSAIGDYGLFLTKIQNDGWKMDY